MEMDRFLFEKFVLPIESDEIVDGLTRFFLTTANNKIQRDKIAYYNCDLQEGCGIQIVVETNRVENNLNLGNIYFHHSGDVGWKFKIIDSMSDFPNTYMASRENENGFFIIRLVNEDVLGKKLERGDVVEAQIVAFLLSGTIYENEEEYEESVPKSADGHKHMPADGAIIPTDFIVNNNANLTEEERKERNHSLDNILDFRGTVKLSYGYELNLFEQRFPDYYMVKVDTQYGELPVYFTREDIEGRKGFGEGNVIAGKIAISGDVCIYDYDKYKKPNDLMQSK